MSCKRYEHWAGLYIEGDLGERRSRKLGQHIEACPACRELVEGLKESQAALKELRKEAPDPSEFLELRRRVRIATAEADSPKRFIWPPVLATPGWHFGLAGAIAVLLLGLALFYLMNPAPPIMEQTADETPAETPRELETVPEVVERVASESPGGPERAAPSAPPVVVHRIERDEPEVVMADVPREKPTAEDLVIKMVTDSPDIVIYWLVERNGG